MCKTDVSFFPPDKHAQHLLRHMKTKERNASAFQHLRAVMISGDRFIVKCSNQQSVDIGIRF